LRPPPPPRLFPYTTLFRSYALADLAHRYSGELRRLRPRKLVAEYEKTILDELDLMREAANASQLKRNFAGSDLLYVPEVHWDYRSEEHTSELQSLRHLVCR